VSDLVSHIDLLPTLLDSCGVPIPAQCVGRSFSPLLRMEPYRAANHVFSGKTFHDDYEPVRSVRSARWKYIRYFEAHFHHDLRTATINSRSWVKDRARLNRRWHEELFDLASDPLETRNLATDPHYSPILATYRDVLLSWMRDNRDPLLDGPVESPKYRALREQFLNGSAPRPPLAARKPPATTRATTERS
jgi:arylsulfatase A-like enzyme